MDFNKEKCPYKTVCKYYNIASECNSGCTRYIEIMSLLETSNIPEFWWQTKKLIPERQDLETFKKLNTFKENILENISLGKNLLIYSDKVGNGKAQPYESRVLAEEGYKKFKDLKIGDKIYGEDGELHNIIGIFPQGSKDIYRITFTDNSNTLCSGEHLWELETNSKAKKVLTVNEILEQGYKKKTSQGWYRRKFKIPMCKPINYTSKEYKISPYLLGLLLGDGCLHKNSSFSFSNSEFDIIEKIEKELNLINCTLSKITEREFRIVKQSGENFDINPLNEAIRELGLYGSNSTNKFIPNIYKTGSPEQRIQLLQGLCDTDGFVTPQQSIEYSTASKKLADDVKSLVESLGGTAIIGIKHPKYKYKGVVKEGNISYKLLLKLPRDIVPVTSKKHLKKYTGERQREPYRYIDNIEYIGEDECVCIKVDNPSELYLTNNYIVTHNTSWTIKIMLSYFNNIWIGNGLKPRGSFVNVPQFIIENKDNITLRDNVIIESKQFYKDIDLLILDDIGSVNKTDYNIEQLLNIVDYRVLAGKTTLYTSNIPPKDLPTVLGKRLASRVLANVEVLEIKGGDNR